MHYVGWHLSVLSKNQLPGELVKLQISGLPSQPRYWHFKQTLQVDGNLRMLVEVSEQRAVPNGALFMSVWWAGWKGADRGQKKEETWQLESNPDWVNRWNQTNSDVATPFHSIMES